MQLTEIRINLCNAPGSRLKAFCSLTFDNTFVVRDVKLIEGNDAANSNGHGHSNGHSNNGNGQSRLFLAMPSRKLSDHCPRCGDKNHLRARYCNNCGTRLDENRYLRYRSGNGHSRLKLHADIAHPINAECRQAIEAQVLAAYLLEIERSKQPGYVAPNLDGEDLDLYDERIGRMVEAPLPLRPTGTTPGYQTHG